jgi:hypothetical protein
MWCGGDEVLGPLCVLRCSPVVMGEGACFRDCRQIGQMGVMRRVGTEDCSVSGECEDKGSGVKGRER